jgi:hypothetical protein
MVSVNEGTVERREWRWVAGMTLLLLFVSSVPYLVAWAAAPEGARFTGLLVNPLDGHSYIAKMRQGLEGSWRFRLVFTSEPQAGAHLFLLHLGLGHLARWTGLPLIAVYHGGRVLAGGLLLVMVYRFAAWVVEDQRQRRLAWWSVSVFSGWGWLVAPLTGRLTADLWVPEAFVFYSILDTLHFPLAVALMVVILMALARPGRKPGWREALIAAVASVGLGVVQPFGVIPVYAALALWRAACTLRDRRVDWRTVGWTAAAGLAAMAYPLYGVASIQADPVLRGWNAQNQTPSPPVWDWLLSFGLLTALALPGMVRMARRRSDSGLLLMAWVVAAGVGMYAPMALQRRLALGLVVPVGLLAAVGWWEVVRPRIPVRWRGAATAALIGFSSLTHLFLMAMLVLAALGGEPLFYLGDGEWQAFQWLHRNADRDAVVLCAPETGMFVPAWAGQRVVYGHPFETVDAVQREAEVTAFWTGEMDAAAREMFLRENRVWYVLAGPRELQIADCGVQIADCAWWPAAWEERVVFDGGDVRVYEVPR